MKAFREAFALSAAEVDERTPPGTVRILSQSTTIIDSHICHRTIQALGS
jgi:hypothetical protein